MSDNNSPIPSSYNINLTTNIKLDELDNINSPRLSLLNSNSNNFNDDLAQISFLLSIFDNIVGPKIVHHWKLESSFCNSNLDDQLLKYIAIHTLNGELYQNKLNNQQKFRLYLIKEIECALFSVFFDASTLSTYSPNNETNDFIRKDNINDKSDSQSSPYENNNTNRSNKSTCLNCLSIIVPLNKKNVLINNSSDSTKFLISLFENMILEYKVYAHVKPKIDQITIAIDDLTRSIKKFFKDLCTLRSRGIHQYHITENIDFLAKNTLPIRINLGDTFLNDCTFTSTTYSMNNDFLVNSITSHIITNYNTIVIGTNSKFVDKMIHTLALFMPTEKIRLSCCALEDSSMLSPSFYLQGYVAENPSDINSILNTDFVFKKDSPTTIIDLSIKSVYRTCILHEFYFQKEKFIKNKLQFLYNSLTQNDLNMLFPLQHYIHNVSSSSIISKSTLVTSIIKKLNVLETEYGIKDSFLDLILKDLYLMALNLIEYINNEIVNSIYKKENKTKLSIKKICKDLEIKSEEDLNVLIAHANYIKPDFSYNLIFQS